MTLTPEPNDDDVLAFMEEQMRDVAEPTGNVNFGEMSAPELVSLRTRLQMELRDLGETIRPRTPRGHELHSQNGAIQFALNKLAEKEE